VETEEDVLRDVAKALWSIHHDLRKLIALIPPKLSTAAIAVNFTGGSMNNALVLVVGQKSTASVVPLLADGVTPSGGVLSNVIYTFSDPSATLALDGFNADITGVAPSNGPVSGSVSCTVTDTDGAVSTWVQVFTIQVNAAAPPPQQLTQSVAVEFTTPV